MTVRHRIVALGACAALMAASLGSAPAAAQFTVFDPSNYSQNLLTAARTLQQVNNQITALQNQARMLQNQALQLKSLDYSALAPIREALAKIDRAIADAEGVAMDVRSTPAALDHLFG